MKPLPAYLVSRALAASLLLTPALACAANSRTPDRAAEGLVTHGSIPVSSVSPYVEKGTFRIQVRTKLGRPDDVLPDGTWLYNGRRVAGSDATGTLVVRFDGGRVNSMSLVTPAAATAMIERARSRPSDAIVATK